MGFEMAVPFLKLQPVIGHLVYGGILGLTYSLISEQLSQSPRGHLGVEPNQSL